MSASGISPKNTTCDKHKMIKACSDGDLEIVKKLICDWNTENEDGGRREIEEGTIVTRQDPETGLSPLMAAAQNGHLSVCDILLEHGAPWNAIDRHGNCAGNYATDNEHWDVVNLLVDAGTKAELVLGASIRLTMENHVTPHENNDSTQEKSCETFVPVEHEPCTKPDYLQRNVRYNPSKTALLDDDDDAVMMEWERPLMKAHASIITNSTKGTKRVLNVGFGMGIIDTILQTEWQPSLHIIIEAHRRTFYRLGRLSTYDVSDVAKAGWGILFLQWIST